MEHEFTIEITQTKTEAKIVKLKASSQKEAEEVVAYGINNLGFNNVGETVNLEYQETVNHKYLEDDCTLTEA